MYRKDTQKGFTLIEMMVSVALFSVVMLISVGALLSVIAANKKAQTFKSVVNNLNFAMGTMTRNIRVGTTYHCGGGAGVGVTNDCSPTPGDTLTFENVEGDPDDMSDQVIYAYNQAEKTIERSLDGGASFVSLTAPEVEIETLNFYVTGSQRGSPDNAQPRVLIVIRGTAGVPGSDVATAFDLQTLVTQRVFDQ